MRSSSTLPVPHPNSAPPTPTRLTGPNSDTEEEERGDLIQFYNNIYIEQIKEFALKYTSNAVSYRPGFSLGNRSLSTHSMCCESDLTVRKLEEFDLYGNNFTSRTYAAAKILSTSLLFPPV